MNWLLKYPLLVFIASASASIRNEDIRAVAVIVRHGERTPSATYPGDPYEEHFNRVGWGKLTTAGCHRLHSLGKFLGKKFPQLKRRSVTKLKSSQYTRTINSVKCLMLFDKSHRTVRKYLGHFKRSQNFDTVHSSETEIETLPLKEDPLLNHAAITCERRDLERKNDANIASLKSEYRELFDNLSRVTGETYDDPYFVIGQRLDPIKIEHKLGLQLPSWASDAFLADAITSHDKLFTYLGQLEIEKKLSGVFLQDLIQQFNSSTRGQVSFFVYASHDTTLAPIMTVLDMWRGLRPKNGEAIVLTLSRDDHLRMHYYSQNMTLTPYTPPGCSASRHCHLSTFAANVSKFIPHDWRQECRVE